VLTASSKSAPWHGGSSPRYQWQLLRLLAARKAHDERRQITVSDLHQGGKIGEVDVERDGRQVELVDANAAAIGAGLSAVGDFVPCC
jgi:hypothetical protein